ncbi:hypothetical protein MTO96_022189 [Rhipicephalus appendiculatus]
MTTKGWRKSLWSPRLHNAQPDAAPNDQPERTYVVKDYMAEPREQQMERDLTLKHFAAFVVFALALFLVLSLLFGAPRPTTPQSTGRVEIDTVRPRPRQLKTGDGLENLTLPGPPYEDVAMSHVPTHENVTDETLQEENASTA